MEENLCERIIGLCEAKKMKELKDLLGETQPFDIAEAFSELSLKDTAVVYRLLSKETAADVFVELDSEKQEELIRLFSDKELREMLSELYVDDTVDIIEEMPATVVAKIIKNTDAETRRTINEILMYPEDSAGSIMTPEYVSLKKSFTVAEAFEKIRREGVDKETVYTCYVTENRALVGIVTVKDMLIAAGDASIADIMYTNVVSVSTTDDKEFVAEQIRKYDFLAIPVVDKENRIVGIVTVDDAIDVMQEEATEDMEIMAAMSPSEKPYLKTDVFSIWKKRIPWLLLLMISATFTGMIISGFEAQLAVYTALTAFIPMLMDTGGNSGSQASVTVIRALALDEVEPADILRVIWKELRVSLLCGATLAVANFVKIVLVEMLLIHAVPMDASGFRVAIIVCATLLITVCLAKLIGCSMPLLAKKLGLDPAVMASPFITTIVDALSLLVYFGVATKLLGL